MGEVKKLGGMLVQDSRSGVLLCGDRVQCVTMSLERQMSPVNVEAMQNAHGR